MRERKYMITAIVSAIFTALFCLVVIASDTDLRSPLIKIGAIMGAIASTFASIVAFRMHLDIEESLVMEELRNMQAQYDILCPFCASENVILRKGQLYCLECGRTSLIKKSLILKKVEASVGKEG